MIKQLISCLILITALAFPQQGQADERILNFHSNIQIHKDSSLTITETIKVRAEGRQIRRGIYREFPTNYQDKLGNNYQVAFEIIDVQQNGTTAEWFTKDLRNGVRLYIGSKDNYLSPGKYTYTIKYRTNNQLGHFENFDELYWNITGNDWKFIINRASATIQFPETIPQSEIKLNAYTGYYGETTANYELGQHTRDSISLHTTRPLMPSQGLTVSVGWPKGYVDSPTMIDRFILLLSQNRHLVIFLIGLAVTFFYFFTMWSKYGRDPKPGVIIPLYDPPQKESPAAMRYILGNSYDQKTFTTALISLAVKGYLTIKELYSDEFSIQKTGKSVDFSAGEKALSEALFLNTDEVATNNSKDKTRFQNALIAHKKSLKQDYKQSYFKLNGKYLFIGFALSIATILLGIWLRHPFASIGISVVTTAIVLMILNVLFSILLKAPTAIGRKFMDKAEGLKEYLTIAEGDALRKRYPLEKTPESFERYLPYAFALDIEETWADSFSDTLSQQLASEDKASGNTPYTLPLWYYASSSNALSFSSMTNNLNDSFSTSISSAATPPGSSSGSGFSGGGGGFSGGGGGGGGGGGW